MKKIILTFALALAAVSALAQTSKAIYSRYSEHKGVSAVYISPAMFSLIGRVPELEIADGDVDIAPIIKNLQGMYILDCENPAVGAKLYADVEKLIKSGEFELLLEAKDDGETVRMYTVGDKKIIRSFVLLATDDEETAFINFEGEIPREKLEAMIASAASEN